MTPAQEEMDVVIVELERVLDRLRVVHAKQRFQEDGRPVLRIEPPRPEPPQVVTGPGATLVLTHACISGACGRCDDMGPEAA